MLFVIWIIFGIGAIVFLVIVHQGIGCLCNSFKLNCSPIPPKPKRLPECYS